VLADDPTDVPPPQGRLVAGFDVGRTRDRSELAVFEEVEGRFTCRMLRSFESVPFAEPLEKGESIGESDMLADIDTVGDSDALPVGDGAAVHGKPVRFPASGTQTETTRAQHPGFYLF
jgi:hypothetical protein